jgi:DNA-binding IclR family transcriptional regulator
MDDVAADPINRRARGLDRAFEILQFLRLKRQPMRPNEIAQDIGAPRSSVYELVNLMLRQGILEYRGEDGRVFLGRKLYFLGTAYAEQFDLMRECDWLLT